MKTCLDSVIATTKLNDDIEIIVTMNGCETEGRKYVESLGKHVRFIWIDRRIGAISAFNLAASIANGEYLVKLDDDIEILTWGENNYWLQLLTEPYSDSNMGATGPVIDPNYEEVVGFCMMTPNKLFHELGGFDPQFDPVWGDDIDYCYRLKKAGYKIAQNPPFLNVINGIFQMGFPLNHDSEDRHSARSIEEKIKQYELAEDHKRIIREKHSDLQLPQGILLPCVKSW